MQQQYREIMGNNPSCFVGDIRPVEQVTWYDAVEFCNRLSEKNGLKPYYKIEKGVFSTNVTILGGDGFRLPSEAEWEYACRGGTTTAYYWGNKIDGAYCWYTGNSSERTYIIGMKKPNAFGLYDITGNVYEWCWDWYDKSYYKNSPFKDPQGPDKGRYRVRRGGSSYIGLNHDAIRVSLRNEDKFRSAQRSKALLGNDGISAGGLNEVINESINGNIHHGGIIGEYVGFRVARTMD
jgi:formylglycine-generating enzyme required for sulfatase activity